MLFLELLILCSLSVFEDNFVPEAKILMLNLTVVDLITLFFFFLHNRYKWPRIVQSCGGEFKGPETSEFVDGYASILQIFFQYFI